MEGRIVGQISEGRGEIEWGDHGRIHELLARGLV
jgi:hypothetical protein